MHHIQYHIQTCYTHACKTTVTQSPSYTCILLMPYAICSNQNQGQGQNKYWQFHKTKRAHDLIVSASTFNGFSLQVLVI